MSDTFQGVTHEEMQELKRSANIFIEHLRNRIDEYCRIAFESTLPHNWKRDDNMNTTEMWVSGLKVQIGDTLLAWRSVSAPSHAFCDVPSQMVVQTIVQSEDGVAEYNPTSRRFTSGTDSEWLVRRPVATVKDEASAKLKAIDQKLEAAMKKIEENKKRHEANIKVSNVQAKDPDRWIADLEQHAKKYGNGPIKGQRADRVFIDDCKSYDPWVAAKACDVVPTAKVYPFSEYTAKSQANIWNTEDVNPACFASGPAGRYGDDIWVVCRRSALKNTDAHRESLGNIASAKPQKTIDELVTQMDHICRTNDQFSPLNGILLNAKNERVKGNNGITDDHRKAWKSRLAVKIAEGEEKERCRVLVDREYEDWE